MDESAAENTVLQVHLPGLLPPGHQLVLHRSLLVVLSLVCEQGEPRLLCMEQLTQEEVRVLIPLLHSFPSYASYALVLSHLKGMPMEEAQQQVDGVRSQDAKAWVAFMQPVRTVLSSLRHKLHSCHLTIVAVQHTGYLLRPWRKAAEENGSSG